MVLHAMLTVDLNQYVTQEQRTAFNDHLKEEKWKKSKLTTLWIARFEQGTSREGAIRVAQADVLEAVRRARITSFEAAVQVGEGEPAEFGNP